MWSIRERTDDWIWDTGNKSLRREVRRFLGRRERASQDTCCGFEHGWSRVRAAGFTAVISSRETISYVKVEENITFTGHVQAGWGWGTETKSPSNVTVDTPACGSVPTDIQARVCWLHELLCRRRRKPTWRKAFFYISAYAHLPDTYLWREKTRLVRLVLSSGGGKPDEGRKVLWGSLMFTVHLFFPIQLCA